MSSWEEAHQAFELKFLSFSVYLPGSSASVFVPASVFAFAVPEGVVVECLFFFVHLGRAVAVVVSNGYSLCV